MNTSSSNRISNMKKLYYDKYECVEFIFILMLFPFIFGFWITSKGIYNSENSYDFNIAVIFLVITILLLVLWIVVFIEMFKRKYSYKKKIEDTIKYEEIKDDYYRVINIA